MRTLHSNYDRYALMLLTYIKGNGLGEGSLAKGNGWWEGSLDLLFRIIFITEFDIYIFFLFISVKYVKRFAFQEPRGEITPILFLFLN